MVVYRYLGALPLVVGYFWPAKVVHWPAKAKEQQRYKGIIGAMVSCCSRFVSGVFYWLCCGQTLWLSAVHGSDELT